MDSTTRRVAECALSPRHHQDVSSHEGSSSWPLHELACFAFLLWLLYDLNDSPLPSKRSAPTLLFCPLQQEWHLGCAPFILIPESSKAQGPRFESVITLFLEPIGRGCWMPSFEVGTPHALWLELLEKPSSLPFAGANAHHLLAVKLGSPAPRAAG